MGVEAEIMSYPGFSHLELYLNEDYLLETDHWVLDTLLDVPLSEEGFHTLTVRAFDLQGVCNESSVGFQVVSTRGESSNLESFDGDQAEGWFFSGWVPDPFEGYDGSQSMKSASSQSVAITMKNFTEAGSIRFHVKHGAGNLEFLVDGKIKSRWFEREGWGDYAYAVPQGRHVFKWIASGENTCLDQVSFTPGLELHSPGEHFGGGIIFYLDSTAEHGLIAAGQDGEYNRINEIPWGCYGVAITAGNRAQSTSNGAANTLAIVSGCNQENIAARFCHHLSIREDDLTWDDWYLPALDELRLLYKNRDKLEGFDGQYYWSSTSFSTHAASVVDFRDGKHHGAQRNIPNVTGPVSAGIHVRPVRKF
jgi:hypothetical protein